MPQPARMLTVGKETLSLEEWSKRPPKVPVTTIRSRLRLGWTAEEAVTVEVDRKKRPVANPARGVARSCPRLRQHKGTGQAYCEWETAGKRDVRYFGKWDTPEAEAAYARFSLEWATRLSRGLPAVGDSAACVADLVTAWVAYCKTGDDGEGGYLKHGVPTSEVNLQRAAMHYIANAGFGPLAVDEFRPDQLRQVRRAMIDAKLKRNTVNAYQQRIVQMFAWGVGRNLVAHETLHALREVGRLQKGKSAAPDAPKRRAVAWADVEAIFPHLHTIPERRAVLESLVRAHWFIGCRPEEIVTMRPSDLDRTGEEWLYTVDANKNEHRDQSQTYWIGPKAQAILSPLLAGAPHDAPIFNYPAKIEGGATTPIPRATYTNRIKDACSRAGVKTWTAHQLRHSRATEIMRIFESNDAAAAAIGDSPEVTRTVYVDPLDAVKKRIARQTG